jgi:hypothetical protein
MGEEKEEKKEVGFLEGFFDLLDATCAEVLEVEVDEYTSKVDSIPQWRADIIILALLEGTEAEKVKAKRIFNLIQ